MKEEGGQAALVQRSRLLLLLEINTRAADHVVRGSGRTERLMMIGCSLSGGGLESTIFSSSLPSRHHRAFVRASQHLLSSSSAADTRSDRYPPLSYLSYYGHHLRRFSSVTRLDGRRRIVLHATDEPLCLSIIIHSSSINITTLAARK